MLCECSTPGCQTIVMVDLDEYEQIRSFTDSFLTAPNHEVEGGHLIEAKPAFEIRIHSGTLAQARRLFPAEATA